MVPAICYPLDQKIQETEHLDPADRLSQQLRNVRNISFSYSMSSVFDVPRNEWNFFITNFSQRTHSTPSRMCSSPKQKHIGSVPSGVKKLGHGSTHFLKSLPKCIYLIIVFTRANTNKRLLKSTKDDDIHSRRSLILTTHRQWRHGLSSTNNIFVFKHVLQTPLKLMQFPIASDQMQCRISLRKGNRNVLGFIKNALICVVLLNIYVFENKSLMDLEWVHDAFKNKVQSHQMISIKYKLSSLGICWMPFIFKAHEFMPPRCITYDWSRCYIMASCNQKGWHAVACNIYIYIKYNA